MGAQGFGWFRRLVLTAVAGALAIGAAPTAHAGTVALTFDDLPIFGKFRPIAEADALTDKLVGGIERHHWPAIGFVNEIQLEAADKPRRIALLTRWLDAGLDLGNHSYSHPSLTNTPVETYIADVARGDVVTRPLMAARGKTEHWYRYPFLETGPTLAARQRFEGWLAAHGYRVAPVTMENSDWQFAEPYDDALRRGDAAQAAHIRAAYLDFTARVVPWYRQAGVAVFGREPAFVFLLHASQLNADSIDALADILKAQDLTPVTLDQAMADPAYRTADTYVGPDGEEWLERFATTLHKSLPWSTMPQMPADIVAADAALEGAQPAPTQTPAAPAH